MAKKDFLSTQPYKGVRDFYPEEMAIQRYIFDNWSHTAEAFGFERYDASVLEPAELYKSKGAENEELVKEQTYTFIDRGEREVTLRPEMTPTVARMIAGKRNELDFPVRWYSIPNLFRYERMQKGRLREHWQLNCDIFGATDYTADVEIIALAYQIFANFGASKNMFEIRINNRASLQQHFADHKITDAEVIRKVTNIIDKKRKLEPAEFEQALAEVAGGDFTLPINAPKEISEVIEGLNQLGINNVIYDPSIVRGFDYYTGTVFEIFDVSLENNRAMLGGGRYDNLTSLFLPASRGQAGGDEPISGIGFGMGDVTMRDFLTTHNLLNVETSAPKLMIIPTDKEHNLAGQKIAWEFRQAGISVAVDNGERKLGKKISSAGEAKVEFVLVVGADEVTTSQYKLKQLSDGTETSGTLAELTKKLSQ